MLKLSVVSDVAEFVSGQTPKGVAEHVGAKGEVPWFNVAGMNHAANQREMVEFDNFLTKAKANQLGLKVRQKGSMIFPRRGGDLAMNKTLSWLQVSLRLNIMGLNPKIVSSDYL